LWATPRASDKENRTTKPTPAQLAGKHGAYLAVQVILPSLSQPAQDNNNTAGKNLARLNPKWVLQLMGYPANWLSEPSVTVSYPPSRTALRELSAGWKE